MIKELLAKPKIKFILAFIVILVIFNIVLSLYHTYAPSQPSLDSLVPNNGATKIVLNQNITLSFKVPVSASDFTISSTPSLSWQISQINPKTISAIHLLDFQPSTTYTINVSWKSQAYPPLTIATMESQTDSLLIQNMKDELERDYPLAQKLPYTTESYRVVYSAPMTLEIALKNQDILASDAISEIKSWVTQNGGDASAHKYIIASPTSSPAN